MLERFIGLMSGTSADGVDAVVARFESGRFDGIEASHHLPHPSALRQALIALGRDARAQLALADWAALDVTLAVQFAEASLAVLHVAKLKAADICAIGSHGQTVFHDPKLARSSLQLGDPNHIAAITGIAVVADFRRMDVALGGQGAPLVPAFHQSVFTNGQNTVVVNIGGIANVTVLPVDGPPTGYDCGPGNALMDEWAQRHLGQPYDRNGDFASQGRVVESLLQLWLAEPYFQLPAPKSTGRALFNLDWAEAAAPGAINRNVAADIQATFCELTARTVCTAVPTDTARVLVCGGGAFNQYLMKRIGVLLPDAAVNSTQAAGLPPQWVEAAAFAWLAHQRLHHLPGNLPSVTGANRPAVLGGLYG